MRMMLRGMVPSPTIEGNNYYRHFNHLNDSHSAQQFPTQKKYPQKEHSHHPADIVLCTCLLLADIVPPSSSVSIGGSGGLRVNPSGITESFT